MVNKYEAYPGHGIEGRMEKAPKKKDQPKKKSAMELTIKATGEFVKNNSNK